MSKLVDLHLFNLVTDYSEGMSNKDFQISHFVVRHD